MNDLNIVGGRVADGTGAPLRQADVAIRDGLIVDVGERVGPARQTLEAGGCIVAPGFMDIHGHADLFLLTRPASDHRILQGVTAEVVGNCGFSAAPTSPETLESYQAYSQPVMGGWPAGRAFGTFADYMAALDAAPKRHHAGTLVGAGALRVSVAGYRSGKLSPAETDRMHAALREALDAGALGLSLGLMYAPEMFFDTADILGLARVAADYGRPVTVHLRGEGRLLLPGIREMVAVARESSASVHFSHLKAAGAENWGWGVREALSLLDQARAQGVDVTADAYPYTAGSTTLLSLLPPWALEGGTAALQRKLSDPAFAARLAAALDRPGEGWDNLVHKTGWDRVMLSGLPDTEDGALCGRTVADCARDAGQEPAAWVLDLIARTGGAVTIIFFHMAPEDVDRVLSWPHCAVISDSVYADKGLPHPRAYGTYGRLLGEFVRERGVLAWEDAVRRATALPAGQLGLKNRGRLAPGYFADVTVFDPAVIADAASYLDPCHYPRGMAGVLIEGHPVLWQGRVLPGCHGRVLRPAQ